MCLSENTPAHWSIQTMHQNTGHTLSEKDVVNANIVTVHQLLQLRNILFSLCKMCNSNGSEKVALCSLLGILGTLDGHCMSSMLVCDDLGSCVPRILLDVQN